MGPVCVTVVLCLACTGKWSLSQEPSLMEQVGAGGVGLCQQHGELSAWLCVRQDFTEDVNCAFEFLLKLTPLLDKADQRCK